MGSTEVPRFPPAIHPSNTDSSHSTPPPSGAHTEQECEGNSFRKLTLQYKEFIFLTPLPQHSYKGEMLWVVPDPWRKATLYLGGGDPLTLACACSSASSDACDFSTKPEVYNLNQKELLQYIKQMKFHTDSSLAHTSHTFSELYFFSAKMQKSHTALFDWLYCQWNQYCVNLLLRPWFRVSGGLTQRFLHSTHVENW